MIVDGIQLLATVTIKIRAFIFLNMIVMLCLGLGWAFLMRVIDGTIR